MRRILLWVAAFAFAAWELVGVILWVWAAGPLGRTRPDVGPLRSDWYLLSLVTNHLVIAGILLLRVCSGGWERRSW